MTRQGTMVETSTMELPARFGKYELQESLGGGMSHVFRAWDTMLLRPAAVKILSSGVSADPKAKARFLQEARLASRLTEPCVIRIYDVGEELGRPYIAMEFLQCHTLKEHLRSTETAPMAERLRMAVEIARAIAYIHTHRIIHRDIKPENIQLEPGGRVKLLDFGIAKSEDSHLTRTGFTLGTPHYMAPEQVMGQKITARVDVYAFGVVLYEMISGRRPFPAETVNKIFDKILREPLPREALREAGADETLEAIVLRCTAREPGERYADMNAVIGDLEEYLQPGQRRAKGIDRYLAMLPPLLRTPNGLIVVMTAGILAGFAILYTLLSLLH